MATATKTKKKSFNKNPAQAIQLWIKALRSGKFRQGQGALKNCTIQGGHARYCCLGVASYLFEKYEPKQGYKFDGHYFCGGTGQNEANEESVLVPIVQKWLGIINTNAQIEKVKDSNNCLIDLNDSSGYNFRKIADVIEREFKLAKKGKSELFKKIYPKKKKLALTK